MRDQPSALRPVGDQRGRLLQPAERRRVDDAVAGETGRRQCIRDPCPRRKTGGGIEPGSVLVAGKKPDQRFAFVECRDQLMRLQDQLAIRHASDFFEAKQRVPHVIEHAGAEHEIERADRVRAQLVHVEPAVFDLAVEEFARQEETVQSARVALRPVIPGIRIDRQHPLGAAPLELERKIAVPGADIEHGLAGQIFWHLQ